MNELKKLKKAIYSEPHRGRHAEIKRRLADLERALYWWHPMAEVLGLQCVWVLFTVKVMG